MEIPPVDREQLASMIDQAAAPALSITELDMCLQGAALADSDGNAPVDEGWTPSFDFAAAAADTCDLRAAKLAATESLSSVTSESTTLQATPADWSKLAGWWRLRSRAGAANPSVGVIGIDRHSHLGGWPRSAWDGPGINWDDLPPSAIPGVIGNWS